MRIEQTTRLVAPEIPHSINELIMEMAKDNWMVASITPWGDTLIILFQRTV